MSVIEWARRTGLAVVSTLLIAAPMAGQSVPLVVSTEWLAAHLNDPNVVVLQAGGRQPDPGAERIPGTRYVPYARFAPTVDGLANELAPVDSLRALFAAAGVSDSSHVVLTGQPLSVTRAFFTLDYLGLPRVSVLDGGVSKWKREGRPLQTEQAAFTPGSISPRAPRAQVVASTDWVLAHLGKPGIALFDTRTVGEYTGAEMPTTGHIEGARLIDWHGFFKGTSELELVDRSELARLWAERAAPGDTVVAYCAVGYRASGTYFVSRWLGVPVKLYDGSGDAWSRRNLPEVTRGTLLRTGAGLPSTGGTVPAVSPDGRMIAYVAVRDGRQGDVYAIGADGRGERRITRSEEWEERPSWVGNRVFSSERAGDSVRTTLLRADGTGAGAPEVFPGRQAQASPDGRRVVTIVRAGPIPALRLADRDGAKARVLAEPGTPPRLDPAWSPDGTRFAFTTADPATHEIQIGVANADGTGSRLLTRLTASEGRPQLPAWSPDGRRLAFHFTREGTPAAAHLSHVYVVDVESGAITKLAQHDSLYVDAAPSWFPDGKRLAFQSDRTGVAQIWVMDADGTNPRQVTTLPAAPGKAPRP